MTSRPAADEYEPHVGAFVLLAMPKSGFPPVTVGSWFF